MRHDGAVTSAASTTVPISIGPARAEHAEVIGEMSVEAYGAGGHLPPGHPYARVLRDLRSRLEATLVAEQGGEVVGAISLLEPGHSMCEIAEPGEREVRFLAVRSDRWGAGIARALMEAAEERARSAEADAVVLCVIDSNSRALAFYPRLGYSRLPERDRSFTASDGSPVHLLGFVKRTSRGC